MKKIIIKIITLVLAFLLGILSASFLYNKGNLDMTSHMAEATLPVLYFEEDGEYVNPTYGYTAKADPSCMRNGIVPLDGERIVKVALEKYNSKIRSVDYEVRSLDMERLIQNGTLENQEESGGYLTGTVKIKDLLEDSKEYLLIFHIGLEDNEDVRYFVRISNSSYDLIRNCTEFAKEFHNATLDPDNIYPITQYLETDRSRKTESLAYVDIHSQYKTVIWDQMAVKELQKPTITYLELDEDVVALNMDYQVSYENEKGENETYQVKDYFRIRQTNIRTYLLDYERTAERIFSADNQVFEKNSLNLGIQWEDVSYMANEEGSVVNFIVSDELWSYDVAQNKLSKVFSFKNGSDRRGLHDEFEIQLVNMQDSGSMDFIVKGYMNRGRHEGELGIAVMRYDSLTNTTEELLFIESEKCADLLKKTVGELLYISYDDQMYLSCEGDIYAIDLNIKSVEVLTENLSSENYQISREGDMLAWRYGDDRFQSTKITTMDMKTGVRHTYEASPGEYIRPLGFSGDDFIYGVCAESDVAEDFAGNTLFPLHCVKIVNNKGESLRDFDYQSKGKYVVSAEVQNNRIDLKCVTKSADGGYEETLAEAITSTEEETQSPITLQTAKDSAKKEEQVFRYEISAEGKMKTITPKQVLFEGKRVLSLERENRTEFHAYGRGRVLGIYQELCRAIPEAYEEMGVVTDQKGQVVWERGSRKTRASLGLSAGAEPVSAQNSLEAGLKLLLEQEGVYPDVRKLLDEGVSPYQILKQNSKMQAENFTGCSLSAMLYYISRGSYVFVMDDADHGEIITGYDGQNITVLDALTGETRTISQKDAAEAYEASGNVFFSFLQYQ